jgi:putative salt-induced outer membrane protein
MSLRSVPVMKLRSILSSVAFAAIVGSYCISAFAEDPPKDGWATESQAGVVVTSGNTDTSTLSFGDETGYRFSENLARLKAAYLYQKSAGVVSGKSWSLGLRYERVLTEKLSAFLGETAEGDLFSGVRQRYSTDLGGKYQLVKEDLFSWFAELGYRYTRENLLTVSRSLNYARLYTELEKKFSATVSAKYWIEYLPNFTDSTDWQLNTELSLSAALSSIFSVKSAYQIKYDNEVNAPGLVKTDRVLTTSLVAKF